jgi:hypothetical protein
MKTAYSLKSTVESNVEEIKAGFDGIEPRAVVFFASSCFDPYAVSREMSNAFPNASVFGCTTAGEIVSGLMLKKSIVAMALDSGVIDDVMTVTIKDLNGAEPIEDAMASLEAHYGQPVMDMDYERYVGIILVDGLSMAEERMIDVIGDLTNVTFIGGSAGDDLQFKKTHVFSDGMAYSGAAVLALLKLKVGFDIIKTQSFCPTGKVLKATKVNEYKREVMEFNGKPAALSYAETLGVSVEEAPGHFMRNPVGLMIGEDPYVRSPQQIQDGSMIFYCQVNEGMELSVLESTDIIEDTRKSVETKKLELGNVSGIINFHCILRTLELENKGQTQPYGKLFADIPTIGFSTYGEQYIGHVNQTSTMLLFRGVTTHFTPAII